MQVAAIIIIIVLLLHREGLFNSIDIFISNQKRNKINEKKCRPVWGCLNKSVVRRRQLCKLMSKWESSNN